MANRMAHLDYFPHAITPRGECTLHRAVMDGEEVLRIRESDGEVHPPTAEDLAFIEAERSACGEE